MGIKLVTASAAIKKQGLKMLVYGPAGAGKTYLCSTCPDHSKTLIVSAESGLLSLREAGPNIPVAIVNGYSDVMAVLRELESKPDRFEWVCLDSISEIAETCLEQEFKRNSNKQKAYGDMADTMLRILRDFRNLKCNVVMTAKEKSMVNEETGEVLFVPNMPGRKLPNSISYLFDEVFALTVKRNKQTGEVERLLQTSISPMYVAKDRSGALDFHEPPDLNHISEKILSVLQPKGKEDVA